MKKKVVTMLLGGVVFVSCASKEEVNALQDALIEVQRDVKQLKKENTNLKEMIEILSTRVDELSQQTAENSIEIEKIKKQLRNR